MSIVLNEYEWAERMINNHDLGKRPVETLNRVAKYYLATGYSKREVRRMLDTFLIQCDPSASLPSWSDMLDKIAKNVDALLLSIKADQTITYGIVKSIEDAVNRYVQAQSYGKNFKVTFLDCSPYNRKELGDQYLKACQYGLPFVSMYAASQGLSQSEMDCMNFLENDVLGLIDRFRPLQSSTQTSTSSSGGKGATDEGGAPVKDVGDLTDSGEQSQEDGDDW